MRTAGSTSAVKAPPAPRSHTVAVDTDFIRRTHSDTRSLAKSILTDLYSTKHHEPPVVHASPTQSLLAAGKLTRAPAAPPGGRTPKAVLPLHRRVAAALEGQPAHTTYKRCVACRNCGGFATTRMFLFACSWASSSAGITQEDLTHGLKAIGCPISCVSLLLQYVYMQWARCAHRYVCDLTGLLKLAR